MEAAWRSRSTAACLRLLSSGSLKKRYLLLPPLVYHFVESSFPSNVVHKAWGDGEENNGRRHLDFQTPQHQKLAASSIMSTTRKTAASAPSTSSIPIPARITAKPTIPRPAASSSSKPSGIKPKTVASTSIHEAQTAPPTRIAPTPTMYSSPSTARTRTTSSSTRGVSAANLTSGKTLPVPKSPASRNSKTPSPSKTRPTPLNSPQARRPVSPSPQSLEFKAPPLSVREAIALKRAEAKKAQLSASKALDRQKSFDSFTNLDEIRSPVVDEVELSRWSIRESIERAKSSGSLNLSSRSLHSIPSVLFEVHLGVTPEPLKDVPKESEEVLLTGKTKEREEIPWFEVVDLTVMKLRDNIILQLQPEISLFGSLRTLELRNNRLKFLPDSISELVNLVSLDVSANQLTSLPPDIASLPLLSTLDVSSNQLTSLPLTILSTPVTSPITTSFFAPVRISRASRPLPSLRQLLASNNQISAASLPVEDLPPELSKLDLSHNPLGNGNENIKAANQFVQSLSKLPKMKQLMLEGSQLDDDCFDFSSSLSKMEYGKNKLFSALELIDLGKTTVTEKVEALFSGRPVSFEGEAIKGGVRIILGNRIQKEAWEIEAEKRMRKFQPQTQVIKEDWEFEAGLGLVTEAGRRQARLNATVEKSTDVFTASDMPPTPPKSPISPTRTIGSHGSGQSLANYYAPTSQTLTLPKALPSSHNRTRSLAVTSSAGTDRSDPIVPNQTLPLSLILVQPFAQTLTCLILSNRRADPSFVVPETFFAFLASTASNLDVETEPYFPYLEELRLDGCLLGDVVHISTSTAQTRKEPLFNIINYLFPTLSILDLCDNRLTHLSGISSLLIPARRKSLLGSRRTGLKALRLRGNKLTDLSNLEDVAGVLRKEGKIEGWRLEELDLRENEIAKLPPVLGFLILDVMLVESNIFRVPARRVWEVEGTKGLLQWLKGRADP